MFRVAQKEAIPPSTKRVKRTTKKFAEVNVTGYANEVPGTDMKGKYC